MGVLVVGASVIRCPEYMCTAVLSLTPRVWCPRVNAVYIGESSIKSTLACTPILFADAIQRTFMELTISTVTGISFKMVIP